MSIAFLDRRVTRLEQLPASRRPPTRGAPTGSQVKNLLWRRLRGAHAGAKVPLAGKRLTQMLELGPKWYALGMNSDEEVNFQGPMPPQVC